MAFVMAAERKGEENIEGKPWCKFKLTAIKSLENLTQYKNR